MPLPTKSRVTELKTWMEGAVLGQTEAVDLSLTALLAGGHILLEGPPGVGKTSLAQALASGFQSTFKRIQMTSDLLPSDIVGTLRLKQGSQDFEFRPGPIFCHVLLADELNRTSAKTQSALLEAMAEGRVTVDGKTYQLPSPFFVAATQNPQEFQGVYPLSESQLDRFMIHVGLDVPGPEAELKLIQRHAATQNGEAKFHPLSTDDLTSLRADAARTFVEESISRYAQQIAHEIRRAQDVTHGASVRAILQLVDAAKARAFLEGRDYVLPADLKFLAPAVLGHRLCLRGPALSAGQRKDLVRDAVDRVASPQ